jgi:hypothetical protein
VSEGPVARDLRMDGASVLLFALGIFGGILRVPADF